MDAVEVRHACIPQPHVVFAGDHTGTDIAVETDPSHRYLRYPVLLGRGACKRVYKAFDQEEGIEVAWNQVDLGTNMDNETRERLFSEIHVMKTLKHRNIMAFHDWWYDASNQTINFITEYFTSGNLRQYRKKHKLISEQAIKRWAFQILEGLLYLHAHHPPIVHRDLKCDNILVNGTSGQVKIADLGLASCQRGLSVVGTPEFMAPEIYDEVYDEKVDIYSFGMCMLELATLEYPYSECRSIPAIFRKVSQGIPPAGLAKVSSESLREFITLCINPCPAKRPKALQLLKHPFFESLKPDGSASTSPTHAAMKGGCFSPPFGSCGNLQALGSGGSHVRCIHANGGISFGNSAEGSSTTGTGCSVNSPTAVPLQAAVGAVSATRMPEAYQLNAGGSAVVGSGTSSMSTSSPEMHTQQDEITDALPTARAANHAAVVQLDWQALEDAAQNSGGYARGRTMCLGAILGGNNRDKQAAHDDSDDSDEEVLVALDDVLAPHPEDLLDPETYHLHSQLTHLEEDGCKIMSGMGCLIVGAIESKLSMQPLLSGLPGTADTANGAECAGHLGSMLSCRVSSVALQQQHELQKQTGASVLQAADLPQHLDGQLADIAASNLSSLDGNLTTAAVQHAGLPADRVSSGSRGSYFCRCSITYDGALPRAPSALYARSAVTSSANSILSATAPLISFKSEAAALATAAASSGMTENSSAAASGPAGQLMRTISNSIHKRNAGALAAAGLLQMSPGLFITTPTLLGKLLSKKAGMQGQSSLPRHVRVRSGDSIASWGEPTTYMNSKSPADQQQQHGVEQHQRLSGDMTSAWRSSSCGTMLSVELDALQIPGVAGQPLDGWPCGGGSMQLHSTHTVANHTSSNTGAQVAGLRVLSACGSTDVDGLINEDRIRLRDAVDLDSSSAHAGVEHGSASAEYVGRSSQPAVPGLTALQRLTAGGASVAQPPVARAGFGKILVRRKFARQVLPVVLTLKRSNSF